jgi:hypothetical protein
MTITSIRDFRLPGWSVTLPRLFDYLAIENLVGVVCARQLAGMYISSPIARCLLLAWSLFNHRLLETSS